MTDAPPASYGTGAPSKDSYSGKENRKVQVGEVGLSSDGKLKLREAREVGSWSLQQRALHGTNALSHARL